MKFGSGVPPIQGWHQRGIRFMDRAGWWHEIDCAADGSISIRVPPGLAGKEQSEWTACDAVLSVMNCRGGKWSMSEKPEGAETGVDRVAFAHTVTDRRRASDNEVCKMQVTKVINDRAVWKALRMSGSSQGYSIDAAVNAMRRAVEAKAFKPAGRRDDIILVLDAMEVPLATVDPVIRAFQVLHGEWAGSLGFQEIWVAGPFNQSVRLV